MKRKDEQAQRGGAPPAIPKRIAPHITSGSTTNAKRAARLNTIAHVQSRIPYKTPTAPPVTLPKRSTNGAYDDAASMKKRRFVRERY